MKVPYKSLNPHAGVSNYEMVDDGMVVEFAGGKCRYLYNSVAPGVVHVMAMKRLAVEGRGLSTYISQCVGKNYAGRYRSDRAPGPGSLADKSPTLTTRKLS